MSKMIVEHTGPFSGHKSMTFQAAKKRKKTDDEFRRILESYLADEGEEPEEYRVLLPKYGHYWDNGYEDVGQEPG